uniref:Uncharacterized protein n=1 Tax=Physcomitrium patens TaxID=3218 RepID=A0A2K1J393_PHYPA|nr:hypothetical protein PHYPA_021840 [Physcomitrium patens]
MLVSLGCPSSGSRTWGSDWGEMGCHLLISSSMQPAFSQHFFGWWTMHRARKGLGLHIQFQGRGNAQSCAGCVEGGKGAKSSTSTV